MKKRTLATFLALCMMISMMPAGALAAGPEERAGEETWIEAVGEEKPGGYEDTDGTVIEISSPEGLAWLAKQVNGGADYEGKTVTLTADIDLADHQWVPIGTQEYPFSGTFDGNNYKISDMTITVSEDNTEAGLFGRVSNATIQNVILGDATVEGAVNGEEDPNTNADRYTGIYIGGIVAALQEMGSAYENTVTIEGCQVDMTVDLTTTDGVVANIGGVLGWISGNWSGSEANISETDVSLRVTHVAEDGFYRSFIGGAIGDASVRKKGSVEISECNLELDVTMEGNGEMSGGDYNKAVGVGGAVGYMSYSAQKEDFPIITIEQVSCGTKLDFSETEDMLAGVPFSPLAEMGGLFGRGVFYKVTDCFVQTELVGNEAEDPAHFGNLAGYTYNDTIECERVYTYAVRSKGALTYENEGLSYDSHGGVMPGYPLTDVYFIEPQVLTENIEGVPFLYKSFDESHEETEGIDDGFQYSDGDLDDQITVTPSDDGKKVRISPSSEACDVHGSLTLDSGFQVDFTLPVVVESGDAVEKYNIAIEKEGRYSGTVETNPQSEAEAGAEVIITTSSANGVLESLIVTRDDNGESVSVTRTDGTGHLGNHTYTFVMPASDVTIKYEFRAKKTEVTMTPSRVDFATMLEGYQESPEAQTVTVKNTGEKTTNVKINSEFKNYDICFVTGSWDAGSRKVSLDMGETATFTVRPKGNLTVGTYSESIWVMCGSTSKSLRASFTVKSLPEYGISVSPTELEFGSLQEGYTQPEAQTVTIENVGKNQITVTLPTSETYEITGNDWGNQQISLAKDEKATVKIRPVSGLSTGKYTEEIAFSTDHPEVSATVKGIFEVKVTPTYTISTSPATLDFGSAQEGYTQPVAQTVTITNDGNQDVTITLPTLTGYTITAETGGWDTDNKVTFGPGDKVTFTVQPNTGLPVGNHNGTITVETGIGTSAEIKVAFTVTATSTPDPDPDPDPDPNPGPNPGTGTGTDDDNDYTLYYHSNFGKDKSFYQSEDDRRMEVRDYSDMSARLPDREGYVFTGWNTEPDGSGDDYAPGDIFRLKRSTDHLYAQWARAEDGVGTGVSRWLNTDDHSAYLSGYPDGAFGPDRNMTRAEVAQMFYGLLWDKEVEITASFTDVSEDAWYAEAVNTLASLGLVSGVGDGQFAPDRAVTRAEFATMAMGFAYLETGGENHFSDVSRSDWFYEYVVSAAGYGWISGYPDGTFRPGNTITRGEVTTIVNNMLARAADEDYVDDHEEDLVRFTDLSGSHWAYYQIMEATNGHDYRTSGGVEQWRGLR